MKNNVVTPFSSMLDIAIDSIERGQYLISYDTVHKQTCYSNKLDRYNVSVNTIVSIISTIISAIGLISMLT